MYLYFLVIIYLNLRELNYNHLDLLNLYATVECKKVSDKKILSQQS